MQKVELKFRTPIAEMENGKPVVKFIEKKEVHIVASTKSQNNLIDEMKREGKFANETKVVDLFLDKVNTEKAVAAFVDTINESDEVKSMVVSHIMKALDSACVFKKPPIVRNKA